MKKILIIISMSMLLTGCNIFEKLVNSDVVNMEPEIDDIVTMAPDYLTTDGIVVYDEDDIEETDIIVEYNGEPLHYDPKYNLGDDSEVLVIMLGTRSLVPLRELAGVMGYSIEWDGAAKKQTLYIKGDNMEIETKLNSNLFFIRQDGKTESVYSETPVIKYANKIYVPVRFIGETFGVDVEWLGEDSKVKINSKEEIPNG